ncbi:hypothetical protein AK830_g12041, partial [Neonectria ditissima]
GAAAALLAAAAGPGPEAQRAAGGVRGFGAERRSPQRRSPQRRGAAQRVRGRVGGAAADGHQDRPAVQDGIDDVQQQQEAGDGAKHDAGDDGRVRRAVGGAVGRRDGDEGGGRGRGLACGEGGGGAGRRRGREGDADGRHGLRRFAGLKVRG